MIKYIFRRLNINFRQWWQLTRSFLLIDFRQLAYRFNKGKQTDEPQYFRLALNFAFFVIIGGVWAFSLMRINSPFLQITFYCFAVMVFSVLMILLDFNTVITAPEDYFLLSSQPLSSRTIFASKITNILVFILVNDLFFMLPFLVFSLLAGKGIVFLLVAEIVFLLGGILSVLILVAIYSTLLKIIGYKKVKNVLSVFQVILGFGFYLSIAVVNLRVLGEESMNIQLAEKAWFVFFPPYWISSWGKLFLGGINGYNFLAMAFSVIAFVLLGYLTVDKFSLTYSKYLSRLVESAEEITDKTAAEGKRLVDFFLKTSEDKLLYKLLYKHVKYNQKFKQQIFALFALVIFYFFYTILTGDFSNPFINTDLSSFNGFPIYFALAFIPALMLNNIYSSDSYKASWIFFTSPLDKRKIIYSLQRVFFIFFILPFLIIMAFVFLYFFNNLLHVIFHMIYVLLLSMTALNAIIAIRPNIPFSTPPKKNTRTFSFMIANLLGFMLIFIPLALARAIFYRSSSSFLIGLLLILGLMGLSELIFRVRINKLYGQKV